MPQEKHPIPELLIISTIAFLSGISAMPLYFIGQRAEKSVIDDKAPEILTGVLCAVISLPFFFQFADHERRSLPQQWRIANRGGKIFIVGTSAIALAAAGTANCYYMEGNIIFKIIALLFPAIAARSIIANWLLRTYLAINALARKSSYRGTYHALQLLTAFSHNLTFNDVIKRNPDSRTVSLIVQADGNLDALPEAIEALEALSKNKDFVVPGYPIKFIVLGIMGGLAGYFMFFHLGPRAGACVFGSNLQFHYDEETGNIICPAKSDWGKQIGEQLGHITYGIQTCVTIFPLIALFNILQVSSHNEWRRSRNITYLVSAILAVFRATIAPYIESQNDGSDQNLGWLIYTAFVFYFFNFFSMAISGPQTIKTIFNTLRNTCQQLCRPATEDKETTVLLVPEPSAAEALAACGQLQNRCLFHPAAVNDACDPPTDSTEPEKTGILCC